VTASVLLETATSLGIFLTFTDGQLVADAPDGDERVDAFLTVLASHRVELLAALRTADLPAWALGDPELVRLVAGGLSLDDAFERVERMALVDEGSGGSQASAWCHGNGQPLAEEGAL